MVAPREIGYAQNFKKIPVQGLVVEQAASAPSSPVNGQLWYDTGSHTGFIYENGSWVAMSQAGVELVSRKGQANGYASLDAGAKVPNAQLDTGTGASQLVLGNDARLSDQRTPADNSVTSAKIVDLTIVNGDIANATITDAKIAAANKDGAAGTASMRTLGTSATQAAAGNDARLTDQRTPLDNSVTSAKIVDGTIVHGDIAAANKDGLAATPSMRTLGSGAQQALAGNTPLNLIAAPTGTVNMNGQTFTGLPAPSANDHPVRLSDLQAAQAGIDNKPSVRFVGTTNKAPTGLSAFEGQTPVAGNRILLTGNSTASENGPWIAAAGAWTRPVGETVTAQSFWMVEEGPNAGTQWKVNTADPITLGTTALTINQWGASGTVYTGTSSRITVTGGAIDIASNYVGQTSITTLGTITTGTWSGTAIALNKGGTGATDAAGARANLGALGVYRVTLGALTAGVEVNVVHNLNTTTPASVNFVLAATGDAAEIGWRVVDANTLAVQADTPYAASALRMAVAG